MADRALTVDTGVRPTPSIADNVFRINVVVKVAPARSQDTDGSCITLQHPTTVVVTAKQPKQSVHLNNSYTFDRVLAPDVPQETVFEQVGRPIADRFLAGYNGTILAYGQTGSGKTYSIQGPASESAPGSRNAVDDTRGIMPRTVEYVFDAISRRAEANPSIISTVSISYLQLYLDKTDDLLANVPEPPKQPVRRGSAAPSSAAAAATTAATGAASPMSPTSGSGSGAQTLTTAALANGSASFRSVFVGDAAECLYYIRRGADNRRTGATAANAESSRSHSVFRLKLHTTEKEADGSTVTRLATFTLVDLAGSERQKEAQTKGVQLSEACSINSSLSTLSLVISRLKDAARTGKTGIIPYRDSALTYLLQDSFGGNCLTCLIACISPAMSSASMTLSTLRFASNALEVKNNAKVNETRDQQQRDLLLSVMARNEDLEAQVERLTQALAQRGHGGDHGDGDGDDGDECASTCANCALASSEISDLQAALDATTAAHTTAAAELAAASARLASVDADAATGAAARTAAETSALSLAAELAALRAAHEDLVQMQAAEQRARAVSDERDRELLAKATARLKTADTDAMSAKAALAMLQTQFDQARRAWATTEADLRARADADLNAMTALRDDAGRSLRLARDEAAAKLEQARAETEAVRSEKAAAEEAAASQLRLHDAAVSKMHMYKAKAHSDQLRFQERFVEYERDKEALEQQLKFALADRSRLEAQLTASTGGAGVKRTATGTAATAGVAPLVRGRGRSPAPAVPANGLRTRAPSAGPAGSQPALAGTTTPPSGAISTAVRGHSRMARVNAAAASGPVTATAATVTGAGLRSATPAAANASNAGAFSVSQQPIVRPGLSRPGSAVKPAGAGTPTATAGRARLSGSASSTALLTRSESTTALKRSAVAAAAAAAASRERAADEVQKITDGAHVGLAGSPFFAAVEVGGDKENSA